MLEALVALAAVETGIAPETRLAGVLSLLLHPALTPAVRQKAERLLDWLARHSFLGSCGPIFL